jgi:hypothetical protein
MATKSRLTTLAEEKKSTGLRTMSKDSVDWLKDKIEEIRKPSNIAFRIAFLTKLMKFALLNTDHDIKRMRISYEILTASRRFAEFRPCLKRYLFNHIRSRVLTIKPDEWDVATMLPIQQFRGAQAPKVWRDSVLDWKDHMKHFNTDKEEEGS